MTENKISGFYQVSSDDYYFKGHFVGYPLMPGVLIVESLAQLSTILLRKKIGDKHRDYHFLAYNLKGAQFYKPVFPKDKIILKSEVLGTYELNTTKIANVKGQAFVEEEIKCEVRFSVVIIGKNEFDEKYKKQKQT